MDSVQEHCPNFDEPLYRCLQSPDEWLKDHVIVQFVKHLQHGMPVPDQAVIDVVFGPGFFDSKHECWQGNAPSASADRAMHLQRVLAGQCTFSDVKRLLLPMNVSIGGKDRIRRHRFARSNCFSTVPASVTVHAQNAQINGFDCGLWTLCALYTRALRRTASKSKPQLIFDDMFWNTPHDTLQFR
jgi:hypothetical protein